MTPMMARIPEWESILIRGILEVNRRMTQTPQIPPISTPQSPTGNPARKPLSLPSGTTTLLPVRAGVASGTSNSQRGKQRQARRTFHVAGSIRVKILSSTEHTPGSETSLAIDTEGVPGRGPDPVTGEDPTTATIYYEISGGRVQDFPRREITLEIDDDDDPSNTPLLTVVLDNNITGVKKFVWDGKLPNSRVVSIMASFMPT